MKTFGSVKEMLAVAAFAALLGGCASGGPQIAPSVGAASRQAPRHTNFRLRVFRHRTTRKEASTLARIPLQAF